MIANQPVDHGNKSLQKVANILARGYLNLNINVDHTCNAVEAETIASPADQGLAKPPETRLSVRSGLPKETPDERTH